MAKNGIMMQYFEWYLQPYMLWRQLEEDAPHLAGNGITALWIPPSYKGAAGINDVGYGVYDLYDLGEFDQKGTTPTKYGTREELVAAVKAAHAHGIQIYADVVLDHKMGADEKEEVEARAINPDNRNEVEGEEEKILAWTYFYFPGRDGAYSKFEWHWYHFTGIDWDSYQNKSGVFQFEGKEWSDVDKEKGNFDYLMGADIDLDNQEVIDELNRWGKWFVHTTDVDGFRIDAVKHQKFTFYRDWLDMLRREEKEELFSVGEYWNGDLEALRNYVNTTDGAMSLFDVPLHYRFYDASQKGNSFDMRTIFDDTLTHDNPMRSVTFVDNHDTQPGQALQSWVDDWFRPLAYALILLRQDGYPCIFYGDYYGIPHDDKPSMRDVLAPMMRARSHYAYGEQHDYFDHPNTVGWTREGDHEHMNSGLAVLMTNGSEGSKEMYVGKHFAGVKFYDRLGGRKEIVTIDENGNGTFFVNGGSVSVWLVKQLELLEEEFTVCKVAKIPQDIFKDQFVFLAKTDHELSLVCKTASVPKNTTAREDGWSALRFQGQIDFSETGVLHRFSKVMAEEGIGIFAISTYDTDYLLLKTEDIERAVEALKKEGYSV